MVRAGPGWRSPQVATDLLSPLLRTLLARLGTRAGRPRLAILMFHQVLERPSALFPGIPDVETFRWQMTLVSRLFHVLPLAEAVGALRRGSLPPRALAISFDDGYRNNLTQALPVLQSLGLPATFFVATGFLDGQVMWNDRVIAALSSTRRVEFDSGLPGIDRLILDSPGARRRAIERILAAIKYLPPAQRLEVVADIEQRAGCRADRGLMLDPAGVRALAAAGMEIGAHTRTHPILTALDPAAAEREIRRGREELETLLGRPVRLFAYPNGRPGRDYGPEHVAMVRRAGFLAAVSTAPGTAEPATDPFQLPRFTPWDRTALRFGLRMARNYLTPVVSI